MKKIDGFYVDENNNKWSTEVETLETATAKSKTLIGCRDCSDCRYCSNCSNCSDCRYCRYCSYCSSCSSCRDCSSCSDCRYCSNCSSCSDCSGYKENPQRIVSPRIGSRQRQTTVYWTGKEDVQVVCGCFKGSLEEFKKKVIAVHNNSEYCNQYLTFIEKVEVYAN